MKQINYSLLVLMSLLIFSCSTSDKVTSTSFIQPRKYNNGFYISLKKKFPKTLEESKETGIFKVEQNTNLTAKVSTADEKIITEKELKIKNSVVNETAPYHKTILQNQNLTKEKSINNSVFRLKNKPLRTLSSRIKDIHRSNITSKKSTLKSDFPIWAIGLILIAVGFIMFLIGVSLWTGGLAEFFGIGGIIVAIIGVFVFIDGLIKLLLKK